MDGWDCPKCRKEHDCGDYPDHWMENGREFTFECDCGHEFKVQVDWSPQFIVVTP